MGDKSVSCSCVDKLLFESGAILEKLLHVGMIFEITSCQTVLRWYLGNIYMDDCILSNLVE